MSPPGQEVWRDRLEQGRTAFNGGRFFEAHELWEETWHALTGSERVRVQGLIQIAAALHHLQGGRRAPAAALLTRGLEKLARGTGPLAGTLEIAALVSQARHLLEQLSLPGAPLPDPIRLVL